MRIHREGNFTIFIAGIAFIAILAAVLYVAVVIWIVLFVLFLTGAFFALVVRFFRVPRRTLLFDERLVVSPANGRVVIIEETFEKEYFKEKRLQVSIFMSPLNVHLNRYPISGKVVYSTYHPGKYLVAWAPKASEVNECHSVVIKNEKTSILVKQIAGLLARRIVNYAKTNTMVRQNDELGFIKFGSRVDLFFPIGTTLSVRLGQKTIEGVTPIAVYE